MRPRRSRNLDLLLMIYILQKWKQSLFTAASGRHREEAPSSFNLCIVDLENREATNTNSWKLIIVRKCKSVYTHCLPIPAHKAASIYASNPVVFNHTHIHTDIHIEVTAK